MKICLKLNNTEIKDDIIETIKQFEIECSKFQYIQEVIK
jgi:hypothetical protein